MILNPGKTEFDDQDHAQIVAGVKAAIASDGLTQADISRLTEVSATTLSTYLRNEYTGDRNAPATKLNKWLENRKRAAAHKQRLPVQASFVLTQDAKRMMQRFDYALNMGRMILVGGQPGLGKSVTCRQYAADDNRRWLATMDKTINSVPAMLIEILEAMGEANPRGVPRDLHRKIVKKAIEAPGLIIIDEAQHLNDASIEALRAINDSTRQAGRGVGIAIVGNDGVYARVGSTGTKAEFAQVSSRFAARTWLQEPDPRDVIAISQAIADANREIIGKAELDYLKNVAARPGGLRNVEMTFEGALLVAIGTNQPLALEHLQGAFHALSGIHQAA
ncbi:AAA family ATPase [Caulobacter sp.]|uniref:AAA family ATPase n=1 Tax=Caulobacter sp. TaxID=78 RepID=UPI002B46A450|nr:AAA family ATPase [Caulobacter sp.]HJV42387.1 AAA family ATPase [Caulobacter sp.]